MNSAVCCMLTINGVNKVLWVLRCSHVLLVIFCRIKMAASRAIGHLLFQSKWKWMDAWKNLTTTATTTLDLSLGIWLLSLHAKQASFRFQMVNSMIFFRVYKIIKNHFFLSQSERITLNYFRLFREPWLIEIVWRIFSAVISFYQVYVKLGNFIWNKEYLWHSSCWYIIHYFICEFYVEHCGKVSHLPTNITTKSPMKWCNKTPFCAHKWNKK